MPFDAEIWYGERVAVLGPNGAGKSHFLRLVAGDTTVAHDGEVRLGARVVPGHFNQTHEHPDWHGRTLLELLEQRDVVRGPAMGMLRRYELQRCAEQRFETLSGGQQARFQILLLELDGATMLLLDEPTDNLDLESAEALEDGLAAFEGTVVAVTHDRWFLRRSTASWSSTRTAPSGTCWSRPRSTAEAPPDRGPSGPSPRPRVMGA